MNANLTDADRFAVADKIPARTWKGWIKAVNTRDNHFGSDDNHGFFRSVEHFITYCLNNSLELPEFVWATSAEHLSLDADSIIENAVEDHHEDARSQISQDAENALQAFLDEWVKRKDVNVCTYHEDWTRAVVFDAEDRAKFAERQAHGA